MISQSQEPRNFSRKPREPGSRVEEAKTPAGGSFEKTPGGGAVGKKRNPRWTSVTKTSTRELKRIHGACKGGNPVVADELRRRGFNSKMLEELIWEWGQRQWQKAAKRASKISTAKNAEARRQRRRLKRRRWRQR
jgi:hypothetical protein